MRTSDREIFTNAHMLIEKLGSHGAQELSVRKIVDMEQQRDVLGMVMWQRVSAAVDSLAGDRPCQSDALN